MQNIINLLCVRCLLSMKSGTMKLKKSLKRMKAVGSFTVFDVCQKVQHFINDHMALPLDTVKPEWLPSMKLAVYKFEAREH